MVEACDRADAVLVLTEWREFVELRPDELAGHGATPKSLSTAAIASMPRCGGSGLAGVRAGAGVLTVPAELAFRQVSTRKMLCWNAISAGVIRKLG